MDGKVFQWEIQDGQSVTVGARTITPQTQVISLRLPFGGFVWNRPASVLVTENGRTRRLPVPDMTRMIVLAAVVVSTAVALAAKLQGNKGAK
jgi:hypothetical protein